MAGPEQLCAHWILQYEAYRVWRQFERDGRADYDVRRWNMLTAKEVNTLIQLTIIQTSRIDLDKQTSHI